jgi:hypothetical protein
MANWDRNFIQGQSEFSQQQRLAEDKFADSKARFDRTTQLDEDKFAQSVAAANRVDAQFWAEFGQQGQQFAQDMALKRKKYKLSVQQEENEVRINLRKLGIQGKEQEQSVLEWQVAHGLDVRKADREDRKVDLSERSIVEGGARKDRAFAEKSRQFDVTAAGRAEDRTAKLNRQAETVRQWQAEFDRAGASTTITDAVMPALAQKIMSPPYNLPQVQAIRVAEDIQRRNDAKQLNRVMNATEKVDVLQQLLAGR